MWASFSNNNDSTSHSAANPETDLVEAELADTKPLSVKDTALTLLRKHKIRIIALTITSIVLFCILSVLNHKIENTIRKAIQENLSTSKLLGLIDKGVYLAFVT